MNNLSLSILPVLSRVAHIDGYIHNTDCKINKGIDDGFILYLNICTSMIRGINIEPMTHCQRAESSIENHRIMHIYK